MVNIMDENTLKQIKENLDEIKAYADKFAQNAGMRWISESLDRTLKLMEPKAEAKSTKGFDMPQTKPEKGSETAPKPEVKEEAPEKSEEEVETVISKIETG